MSAEANLFELCKDLLDNYSECLSPIFYIQNLNKDHTLSDSEKKYVADVFYGCLDKRSILDVIVDGFYVKDGKNTLKSEKNYYYILTYVSIFQLRKNNGCDELRKLTKFGWSQEKILKFLTFLFNEKNLLTWMKDAWKNLFDEEFVLSQLLNPLLNLIPDMNKFLDELENKIYNSKQKKPKPLTQVEPFNLNEPIYRKVLLPDKILEVKKPKETKVELSKSITTLNSKNEMESYAPKAASNSSEFSKKKILPNIAAAKSKETELRKSPENLKPVSAPTFKATPFKPTPNESNPVKLNAAVILREEHVIKKQAHEVAKQFEYLETGERSAADFARWQHEMKTSDLKQQIEMSEKLKLQSKISHEDAIRAREEQAQMNKLKAHEVLQVKSELQKKRMEERREEEEKKKRINQKIKDDENNIKAINEELFIARKLAAQEVIKESEALQMKALKEAEAEMRKKMELIQQIKAAESISIDRTKLVDLTSTAGHGLLSEMSICELKERLELLRRMNDANRSQKHDEIVKSKIQRDEDLVEKLHFINKFKTENAVSEKQMRSLSHKEAQKMIVNEVVDKNESILGLKKKLEELRSERAQGAKSESKYKGKRKELSMYEKQRKMLEWDRMKDLEHTQQRIAATGN